MPPTDPEMNARFTPPVIAATPAPTAPHAGMPPLDASGPALSAFEFWPMWRFYPPVLLYALWLMVRHRGVLLPTVANPSFPGGGFYGESKAEILALAVERLPEWVAPFIPIDRARAASVASVDAECLAAETAMCIAGLAYQKGFGGHFHNDDAVAVLRDIPGLILACPSSGADAVRMLRTCVRLAREEQRVVSDIDALLARFFAKVQALQAEHRNVQQQQLTTANPRSY